MTGLASIRIALSAALVGLVFPGIAGSQGSSHRSPAPGAQGRQITGRVITPHGDPIAEADVEIALAGSRKPFETVETSVQGEFHVAVPPRRAESPQMEVVVAVSKEGFLDAQETVELQPDHETEPVDLVLRQKRPDPRGLGWDALSAVLLPRLREPSTGAPLTGIQLNHFDLALRMLDQDNAADAAPVLGSVARHDPNCIECLTLEGLAEIDSGAWSSAARALNQAARLSALAKGKDRRMEPFVALAALQTWRGEFAKAQISLLQALALKPDDPIELSELGRVFLLQGKMATADQYLARALAHGALRDVHLLRAQALSDLDKPQEAQAQLDAYLDGRKPKQLSESARALYTELTDRITLASRSGDSALGDQSVADLLKSVPDLQGLTRDEDQSGLEAVLQRVGETVRVLFQSLPDTSSREEITMERLHADGKAALSLTQNFEYLAVNAGKEDGIQLSEYRTDKSGNVATPGDEEGNFMVTKGFAADPLIFYPDWQVGSRFRLIGRQRFNGRDAIVIAFAERPAQAKMLEEFKMKARSAVLLVQGLAWVDAASYRVLRMRTELLNPVPEIKLDGQTTDVRFSEVRFSAKDDPFWLPEDVSVLFRWNGRVYHNQHHYSDYAVFQVKTRQHIKAPKAGAGNNDGASLAHSGTGSD
jgi:tetratricopeptide (TPR) repeat protein